MKILSHIVGVDTIGLDYCTETQVKKASNFPDYYYFQYDFMQKMENDHNWRAMLIKDNIGDWAICVGEWKGMQRGISKGRRSVKGDPGHFSAKITFLRKNTTRGQLVQYVGLTGFESIPFQIGSLTCDLAGGNISVRKDEEEPLQHVALAFTLSTLYLLVQPRPETIPTSMRNGRRQVPPTYNQ